MKKKISLILSFILVCICAVAFTAVTLAEGEEQDTITVSYMNTQNPMSDTTSLDTVAYEGGKQVVGVGQKFTLPTTSSDTYAGQQGYQLVWYTEQGRTYKAGETVSFTKDTKLFRCVAKECYTMVELNYAMTSNSTCAILMADINAADSISVKSEGESVLVLNGFTMNMTRNGFGMGAQRSGKFIVGAGTINVTNTKGNPGDYSFFQMKSHGYNGNKNKQLIGCDVTLNAPNFYLGADDDGSTSNHYPWLRIYGTVNCYGFLKITNTNNRAPFIEIFETADVTVTGPRLFYDVSSSKCNYQAFELQIYGGTFNLPAEAETEAFWSNDNIESMVVGTSTYPNVGLNLKREDVIKVHGGIFYVEGGAAPAIDKYLTADYVGSIPSGGDGILAKKNESTYVVVLGKTYSYKLVFAKYADGTIAKLTVTDYVDGSLSGTYYYSCTYVTLEGETTATIDTITVYDDADGTTVSDKIALDFGMNNAVKFTNVALKKDKKLTASGEAYIVTPAGCEHTFAETVVDASCQTQGSITRVCTLCGYSTFEITEGKGDHSYELVSDTAASLTELGSRVFACSICGETVQRPYTCDPTGLEVNVIIRNDDDTFETFTVLANEIFDFAISGTDAAKVYTVSAIKAFGDYKIRNIYGITIPKGIMYVNITTQNYEKYKNVEYGVAVLTVAEGANVDLLNIGSLRRLEKIVVEKDADVIFGTSCSYYSPNGENRSTSIVKEIDLSAGNHHVKFMSSAFNGRTSLTTLKFGSNSSYELGYESFNNCRVAEFNLNTSSTYSFGQNCFKSNSFTEIVFPDGFDVSIASNMFDNCTSLTNVVFGKNATYEIGSYAFFKCPIEKVTLTANSTYTINDRAFLNTVLTEIDMSAGNMNVVLGTSAFNCLYDKKVYCALTSIKFGENSTYVIGDSALSDSSITSIVLAPNSEYTFKANFINGTANKTDFSEFDASADNVILTFANDALRYKAGLTVFKIDGKNSTYNLGNYSVASAAFTSLVLAENSTYTFGQYFLASTPVESIDASANNVNVTFSQYSLRSISNLTELLVNGSNSTYVFAKESVYKTGVTELVLGSGSSYDFGYTCFKETKLVSFDATASNVTATFAEAAFNQITTLAYVNFGENSTYTFGKQSFYGTAPVNDIVFYNNSTYKFGDSCFYSADFASITFQDNVDVTFTAGNAFSNCDKATLLYLGSNFQIDNSPFRNMKALEKLIIMDGVKFLDNQEEYVFEHAGSADFSTPFVVYNHSTELVFTKGMFNNCDGVVLYTVTDGIGTRGDVFMNCADGTGYKGWTVVLGIPHALTTAEVAPSCTLLGGTVWAAADCGCGIIYREALSINVYENKHNIKADTAVARVDVYDISPIPALGHTKGDFVTIVYADGYLSAGKKQYNCTACQNSEGYYEEVANAIFVSLGYSASEFGDDISIMQSFYVDIDAYMDYKAIYSDFSYGVVATGNAKEEAVSPLAVEDGKLVKNGAKVEMIDFSENTAHSYFGIKIRGIGDGNNGTTDRRGTTVVLCAYIFDGTSVAYIEDGAIATAVVGNNYNNIAAKKEEE